MKQVWGFSQIEVKGRTHTFFAGDRCHPQAAQICGLLPQILEMGYSKGPEVDRIFLSCR